MVNIVQKVNFIDYRKHSIGPIQTPFLNLLSNFIKMDLQERFVYKHSQICTIEVWAYFYQYYFTNSSYQRPLQHLSVWKRWPMP